jgi:hypothetical protein
MLDPAKFISGTMMCLSAMLRLEIPHINVLTKMDLHRQAKQGKSAADYEDDLEQFISPDIPTLIDNLNKSTSTKYHKLNEAIGTLIDEHNMVNFLPLDITDEESVAFVLGHIDHAMQYGEDLEPPDPDFYDEIENDVE